MCIEHPLAEGMRGYVVRTFGMKAWRLSSDEAYRIRQLARDGRLPTGTPTGEILAPDVVKSPEGVACRPTMFLFRTREGTWGTLRLTDQITIARDITGQLMVEKGVGFHRGVKFDLGLMLDRRPPASGEPPKTPAP